MQQSRKELSLKEVDMQLLVCIINMKETFGFISLYSDIDPRMKC